MQVRQFQEAVNAPLPNKPTLLPRDRFKLRHELMIEEVYETKVAFDNGDLTEVADGIIDQMYILLGTALEFGLGDRLIMLFDEVQRSNMSKIDPESGKVLYNENGKVMKPESYSKPNLEAIMSRDFSIYSEDKEVAADIDQIVWKEFWDKINSNVINNLHEPEQRLYKTYLAMQEELDKVIDIKVDTIDVRNRAKITLYGTKELTVID